MSFSSSTAPAERGATPGGAGPTRGRGVVVWVLFAIWGVLMIFGVVSLIGPPWLRAISKPGVRTEVRGYTSGGDAFARGGDFAHALERYQLALKIDPNYMPARINAAVVYGQLGRAQEGIDLLRDALTHETGQRGVVLYNLAELLRRVGKRDEAIATYRDAVAAGARPELVYGRLGEMFGETRDWPAARDAFRQAIGAWEDPVVQYRNMLTVARDLPESDSVGVHAIDETLARGVTEADVARYDLGFVRQQLDHDADLGRLYGHLGAVEAQLGDVANGIGHLKRALQIWPANPEARQIREMLTRLEGGR